MNTKRKIIYLDPNIFGNVFTQKRTDDYFKQGNEIYLLKNIVNRCLTNSEKIFVNTIYDVSNNFQSKNTTNDEIAKELNFSMQTVKNIKLKITKKIKQAIKLRDFVNLFTITQLSNKNFLKTLKLQPLSEYGPQKTYYLDDENILYYNKYDKYTIFLLIHNKNFTKLYHDEIENIEIEKKL